MMFHGRRRHVWGKGQPMPRLWPEARLTPKVCPVALLLNLGPLEISTFSVLFLQLCSKWNYFKIKLCFLKLFLALNRTDKLHFTNSPWGRKLPCTPIYPDRCTHTGPNSDTRFPPPAIPWKVLAWQNMPSFGPWLTCLPCEGVRGQFRWASLSQRVCPSGDPIQRYKAETIWGWSPCQCGSTGVQRTGSGSPTCSCQGDEGVSPLAVDSDLCPILWP